MEARNVKVYIDIESNQKRRFYTLFNCGLNKIDMSMFLDDEQENYNKVYGIYNSEIVSEYSVILTYNSSRDNRNYMIITDGNKANDGNIAIYGLIYDADLPDPFVEFIKSNIELEEIYKIMDSVFLKLIK